MNILRSFTETVVTTPTDTFPISFEYDEKYDAVHVFLNDVAVEDLGYTVSQVNAVTLKVEPAIPEGTVRIERETDIDKMKYIFDAGALFIDQNVDADFRQIVHSQQEVRDGFIKLRGAVLPLVNGLQEALKQAQEASQSAQEAAEAAEAAAQFIQTVSDYTALPFVAGKSYAINQRVQLDNGDIVQNVVADNTNNPNTDMTGWVNTSKNFQTVESIADLKAIKTQKDGSVVFVRSYFNGLDFGSGTYKFEQLSTKTPNDGAWIAGSGGVWVLISDLHFENFGVTDEDSDQSDKLQACIDFAFSQNIISYGFEKSFKCRIDKEIVFRAIKTPSDWGMPAQRTEVSMRGAMFVSSVDNLTYIRVLRDRVKFVDTLAMDGLGSSGQIGIELGYNKDNDPMDTTLRRSACFFGLNGYIPANIDIGIKSNIPRSINGSAYGMYNHTIYNFDARHVNIGWYADKGFPDDPVTNKLTRTRIFGFGHIDGACSFYMLACESFKCYGYSGEHINKDDPRLPDGKAVGWYSPEKSNPIDTYQNSYNYISGYIEQAYREYINQSVFFTWDVQSWFTGTSQNIAQQGQAELSLSKMGIGSNGTFYNNRSVKDFHFKNGGFRTAVVSIAKDSPANSSLPNYYRGKDFYGNIEWVPMANDFEDAGLLILSDYFWSDGGFRQYVAQYRNGVWSEWVDRAFKYGIGSNDIVLNNSTLNNFKFNDGGVRFAQVTITGDDPTSAASTPNGNYFYGAVQWIQSNSTEGKQIAWGVAPNTNSQRIFTGGVWSAWTAL